MSLAVSLCIVPALSTVLLASDGKTQINPENAGETASSNEHGAPALFSWADFDGDSRLDLAAVSPDGRLQLLANVGEGRFEDVTEGAGLSGVEDAALALWADYDGDLRLDLFVGAREGASRLFHNDGGVFVDVGRASGLASEGPVLSAHWLDHDGDGRLDLHVVTAASSELYRGLEGGFFDAVALPVLATSLPGVLPAPADGETFEPEDPPTSPGAVEPGEGRKAAEEVHTPADGPRGAVLPSVQGPTISSSSLPPMTVYGCAQSIKDQATVNSCLQASTTPTLGMLHPISANLFVAVGGNVGIGTTTPGSKLEVAGTALITDTLTLAPSGDVALDVSTGSIYKDGTLFLHTKGGNKNVGLGDQALSSVTTGLLNTASGSRALRNDTAGSNNTASGFAALYNNTTGNDNTASGSRALYYNTTGNLNTASGYRALYSNTTGSLNTASGNAALSSNTTGSLNTACGYGALLRNTTGYRNTASGDEALRYNTTGSFNSASGSRALYSNTTGYRNTACGYQALSSNTTGIENTASGSSALFSNTGGGRNTASGYGALHSNTGGFANTASGHRALYSNMTASGNTACGYGALFSNTTGGDNTAGGSRALYSNTTGTVNTASGSFALFSNTSGSRNMASGNRALFSNTSGSRNTASGYQALLSNTSGYRNTASGSRALSNSTTGHGNTACGYGALFSNTTGYRNIALGYDAGSDLTTGGLNIAIGNEGVAGEGATTRIGTSGNQTRAFVAGIRGVTTGVANGIPVLIDSEGQLGTVSSSRRFKEEIRDMGELTDRLLELRPVVFRYKPEVQSGERPLEYGLIAEEVAEVFPELVVYDQEGQPFTVKYHLLSSMLLNELRELHERTGEHEGELAELRSRLAALEGRTAPAASVASADAR